MTKTEKVLFNPWLWLVLFVVSFVASFAWPLVIPMAVATWVGFLIYLMYPYSELYDEDAGDQAL
jgi:hypothetical protein